MLYNDSNEKLVKGSKESIIKKIFYRSINIKPSIKISLLYVSISALWILFSDYLLKVFKFDKSIVVYISIIKGWLFVIITGFMLYLLIEKSMKKLLQSQNDLRENEELYRLVINGTTDGFWDWNIERKNVYFSPKLSELLGYDHEFVQDNSSFWRERIHEDDIDRIKNEIKAYFSGDIHKFICEYRIKNKNGNYSWAVSNGQGIWDNEGNIIRVIGTYTDISQRKEIEEELKRTSDENIRLLNEAIEHDRIKTESFANISHEFRTPLNVLLGSVQLIESYLNNEEENATKNIKIMKHINVIRQNCYRLVKLINNLIDVTKIDSGFKDIVIQKCNIVEVVEQITLSVKEFVENKSIELVFDTDTEEKEIFCDINKIERILLNLLSNAAKFNRPGGSIYVNLEDKNDCVEITVKDTGIGIPSDKIEIIFDRFRQVNSSLTREHEGSGIGLSIVKSLVEMQGGTITVRSQVGNGTEFKVKLPANVNTFEVSNVDSDYNSGKYLYMANVEFSDVYSIEQLEIKEGIKH